MNKIAPVVMAMLMTPSFYSYMWVDSNYEWAIERTDNLTVSDACEINAQILMGKDMPERNTLAYEDMLWEKVQETLNTWESKGIVRRIDAKCKGKEILYESE